MSSRLTLTISVLLATAMTMVARTVINITPPKGDATATIAKALDKAKSAKGPTVIKLAPGVYNLHRRNATVQPYRVSNTASEAEHPTAMKHIGILMHGLSDITIDGAGGATLLTHGEMTPWVIDSCRNITLSGLTINAADPSVVEFTVISRTDSTITARVHPDDRYSTDGRQMTWYGDGWKFTGGIAQLHDDEKGTVLRCASPFHNVTGITDSGNHMIHISYNGIAPGCAPGNTFQMRHSIRNEVAGLISNSSGITLSDIRLAFAGNFGIVAQMSTDLTYRTINCSPLPGTGRTNASFADFFHFSGCNGHIDITGCSFAGSQDDPINIHGTHQLVTAESPGQLTVRYMHPQTFGFQGFMPGDTIAITDPVTLLPEKRAVVRHASMTDPYTTVITLSDSTLTGRITGMVVENITRCPSVNISDCDFTLTPTRCILVSTHRPVRITGCKFLRSPMPAILIADDGRSWYESGPVTDVTISGNRFIDCASPVISISPEAEMVSGRFVHSNISITDNQFTSPAPPTITASSVNGLKLSGNKCTGADGQPQPLILETVNVTQTMEYTR